MQFALHNISIYFHCNCRAHTIHCLWTSYDCNMSASNNDTKPSDEMTVTATVIKSSLTERCCCFVFVIVASINM